MANQKTKMILNPNADLGRAWRVASDLRSVVEEFGGADWSGTVYPTHATELTQQAADQGYDLVIAMGGDGTVHEIINGLMRIPSERRPRLGVVPLGSGNDFSHNVGFNADPSKALQQTLTGKPKRIDVGLIEDGRGRREYWNNTLGIGFDASVTIHSHKLPIVRGFLMYLIAVIQTIILNHEAPRMRIRTDSEDWDEETLMLVMCNGPREGGGFFVAPDAVPDDGLFHYALIRKVSRPMMFRLIPEVMKGTHGRFSQVRMGQFKNLELEADSPLHIHTDGEVYAGFGTDVRRLKVETLPGEIEIMV
jgi:YegS/Rv2252/BmrU family lipid kinase